MYNTICISNHHIVHFKYIILFANYTQQFWNSLKCFLVFTVYLQHYSKYFDYICLI